MACNNGNDGDHLDHVFHGCCITKSLRDNNIQVIPKGPIQFVLHGLPNLGRLGCGNILDKSHTYLADYYAMFMEPL